MDKFSDWILNKLNERNWSQADLARASGLTRQSIHYYLSEKSKQPDEFALQKLAKAFRLPPEEVYRAAGMPLSPTETDPLIDEGVYILQHLEGEDKVDAIRFLRMRLQVKEEREIGKRKPRPSKT